MPLVKNRPRNRNRPNNQAVSEVWDKPTNDAPQSKSVLGYEGSPGDMPAMLDIEQILGNPQNSRVFFKESELQSLAASMKNEGVGMMQAIVVRPAVAGKTNVRKDKFIIVAGSRRFEAAKLAGFKQVPVVIKTKLIGEAGIIQAAILNMIENVQREDLTAIEEADGMVTLKDRMQKYLDLWIGLNHPMRETKGYDRQNPEKLPAGEYKKLVTANPNLPRWVKSALLRTETVNKRPFITWEDVAAETGVSVETLTRYAQISQLPRDVKDDAIDNKVPYTIVREVARVKGESEQKKVYRQARRQGLTGGELAQQVKKQPAATPAPAPTAREVFITDLRQMTSRLAQMRQSGGKFSESYKREVRKEIDLLLQNLE